MGRRILGRASRSRFSVPLTRSHGMRKGEVPRTQFRRPLCSVLGDTVGTPPKGDARRKPLVNTATERTTLGQTARALAFSCGCNCISRRTESKEVRGARAVAQGTFCRKGHLPLGKVQVRPILSARRWRREPFDSKNLNGFSRESMSNLRTFRECRRHGGGRRRCEATFTLSETADGYRLTSAVRARTGQT